MYLVDTHTHIYDHQFSLDRKETVQRALDAGVKMMLLPNVDASTITPMLELHEHYPDCTRVLMGLQPEEVKENYKEVLAMMEKELERGIYIGVGEVGLDFYWDATYEHQQLDAFETQLDWAKQLGLPLSIHCRNAFDKMVKILEKKQDGGLCGIMHCFTGTEEEAKVYLELGFHLGLGGVTTYLIWLLFPVEASAMSLRFLSIRRKRLPKSCRSLSWISQRLLLRMQGCFLD